MRILLYFSIQLEPIPLESILRDPQNCGGHHWLAHPHSQDILSSIYHNRINTETTVASVSGNCKVVSVCGAIRCSSKQAADIDSVRTRRDSVAYACNVRVRVRVLVYCVCLVIHTYVYTTTFVTPRKEDRVVPRISAKFLPGTHHAARL
jgi:hypothetical protein